jgi:AhpD family alkylhydroperoxidase
VLSTTSYPELTNAISKQIGTLRKDIPETMNGFSQMAQGACASGALGEKTKELIAMGIAIALRCDGCIGFHTKTLVKLGASRMEFEEMLAVAIYMGGGPSLMYAAQALDAWEQFDGPQS